MQNYIHIMRLYIKRSVYHNNWLIQLAIILVQLLLIGIIIMYQCLMN